MSYVIKSSKIHGKGVHAIEHISKDTVIDVGINFEWLFYPVVTEHFGAYLNHSYDSNSELRFDNENGWKWNIVATRDIKPDEEITMNYNDTPWYIQGPLKSYV
jgi:SET domain-containing protein